MRGEAKRACILRVILLPIFLSCLCVKDIGASTAIYVYHGFSAARMHILLYAERF